MQGVPERERAEPVLNKSEQEPVQEQVQLREPERVQEQEPVQAVQPPQNQNGYHNWCRR